MKDRPTAVDWLRRQGGRASFADFMAAALHDPEFGYYARSIIKVGRGGDFSTSATLHPLLGRAIAGWLQESWAAEKFVPVIEVGAGDGSLAEAVLASLPWWKRWRLSYHIVDTSAPLVALQKKKLGNRTRWHSCMKEALRAAGGRALIFSNELADAFPCRLLQKSERGWDEIYLCEREGAVVEEGEALPPETWSKWSACAEGFSWRKGQRVEIRESYRQWLSSWVPEWKGGRILTIDYGAPVEMLYNRRPGGTLRAYFSHLRLEGPDLYARMGRQDLTADVNFTDLRNWGEACGLKTAAEWAQRDFVQKYAPAELGRSPAAAVSYLQDPQGAGEAFRVLLQER